MVKGIAGVELLTRIVMLVRSEITGGSFTGVTVSTKFVLRDSAPSLTVIVMVALPLWFVAGVTVTVRLLPLPPKTMLFVGTRVVLEDALFRVKLPAGVSESP